MKTGKYRVIRLTTTRNYAEQLAMGTLYPGDSFDVLHMATGKFKDSWVWGYANGRGFQGWCWIPLVDKKDQQKLEGNPFAAATHTWSKDHGGRIETMKFTRHINKAPHGDGAKTKIELLGGKTKTFLRGNLNHMSPRYDVPLYDGAAVKWRWITFGKANDAFVMVRSISAVPRWGFVRRIDLPSKLPHY